METETVKGFKDISGNEALKREKIKEILVKTFKNYGFLPCETPIIEFEEFVKRGSGGAISDVFKLKDKGERNLALRYEFTFQLQRIAKNKKLPFRRYQIGEVFRDEPVSSARFRQFTQCDIDTVGSTIREEAEILKIVSEILEKLKINATIILNNRKLLNEVLEKNGIQGDEAKENVIREIDKLDKLSEQEVKENLKKYRAEKLLEVFKKPESYFSKFKSYSEIQELMKYCRDYNVKAKFTPSLARGLSYYNGSIFEVKTKEMKETIIAGGSYLVNGIQSTGISFGLDRLTILAKIDIKKIKCIIISISQDKESIKLAEKLRNQGISCFIIDKISKALEYANMEEIPFVIFVGKEELKARKFKLRDMKSGRESLLGIEELIKKLI